MLPEGASLAPVSDQVGHVQHGLLEDDVAVYCREARQSQYAQLIQQQIPVRETDSRLFHGSPLRTVA